MIAECTHGGSQRCDYTFDIADSLFRRVSARQWPPQAAGARVQLLKFHP